MAQNTIPMQTFQDMARKIGEKHGAYSPEMVDFTEWETRTRLSLDWFRELDREHVIEVFPSPKSVGLSGNDDDTYDLFVRWATNRTTKMRYDKPNALVHCLIVQMWFDKRWSETGLPPGDTARFDTTGWPKMIIDEFHARHEEIAAHMDGWDWYDKNRLPD